MEKISFQQKVIEQLDICEGGAGKEEPQRFTSHHK